jgi:DNA-binding MarR family transcriptional regulator
MEQTRMYDSSESRNNQNDTYRCVRFAPLREKAPVSRIHAADDALVQMMPWLMRFVEGGLSAPRLTLLQLRVLFAIAIGERRSGQIAVYIGMPSSSTARIISILDGHGLVTRRRDPRDRRTLLIRLTPAGRALYRGVTIAVDRRCRQLAEALRPRQHRDIREIAPNVSLV